ncbi:MAG: LLM class F420-dependent oxidoreductase [Sciscionella sp.]
MKIGISTFVTDEGIAPADLGAALEERGFESLFVAEHTHIPVDRQSPYPAGGELPGIYYRTLDPFVVLTAAAVPTTRLRLGTGIALLVERDPIVTAKEVASLDLVSDGRVIFGVGAGWNREEMRNHGTDPRIRGALLDERVRAMRALWTEERAEYHGQYVDFDPVYCWPKPVQRPYPPIYVGGASEATAARVREYGDSWMPTGVPDAASLAPLWQRMRAGAGKDVPVTIYAGSKQLDRLDGFAELGVERVLVYLPTRPRDETLTYLDDLASLVERFAL